MKTVTVNLLGCEVTKISCRR